VLQEGFHPHPLSVDHQDSFDPQHAIQEKEDDFSLTDVGGDRFHYKTKVGGGGTRQVFAYRRGSHNQMQRGRESEEEDEDAAENHEEEGDDDGYCVQRSALKRSEKKRMQQRERDEFEIIERQVSNNGEQERRIR